MRAHRYFVFAVAVGCAGLFGCADDDSFPRIWHCACTVMQGSLSVSAEQEICSDGNPLEDWDGGSSSTSPVQTECECEKTSEPCTPDGGMD